jgi:hypothetical protein
MNYKTTITIIVMMIPVFIIMVSLSFLSMDKVFAQSSIFGDNGGGAIGNLFRNFGNVFNNLQTPQGKTSTAPIVSGNPSSGIFDNAAPSSSDKSKLLGILFGNNPSINPSENSGPSFIDKPCHPGKCLGTPGFYTIKGHHHCYEGTRDCIQTSHYKGGHYKGGHYKE